LLDILEDYMTLRDFSYCRIDGSTAGEEREDAIQAFNAESIVLLLFVVVCLLFVVVTVVDFGRLEIVCVSVVDARRRSRHQFGDGRHCRVV
jgi:hypothetical protein